MESNRIEFNVVEHTNNNNISYTAKWEYGNRIPINVSPIYAFHRQRSCNENRKNEHGVLSIVAVSLLCVCAPVRLNCE